MTTTSTPTRQERGIALAQQQGSVKALDAARTVFHVKSSQEGRAPYVVRFVKWQRAWVCGCADFRHIKPEPCKHIEAARHWLTMPRFLVTSDLKRTSVVCKAMARGVAFENEAALVRHHATGNITLETSWRRYYVEFVEAIDAPRGKIAMLRDECGLRWYVPLEAWLIIQPRVRNASPEVEIVALGVAS